MIEKEMYIEYMPEETTSMISDFIDSNKKRLILSSDISLFCDPIKKEIIGKTDKGINYKIYYVIEKKLSSNVNIDTNSIYKNTSENLERLYPTIFKWFSKNNENVGRYFNSKGCLKDINITELKNKFSILYYFMIDIIHNSIETIIQNEEIELYFLNKMNLYAKTIDDIGFDGAFGPKIHVFDLIGIKIVRSKKSNFKNFIRPLDL